MTSQTLTWLIALGRPITAGQYQQGQQVTSTSAEILEVQLV
jgi:hypothetical protein